MQHRRMEAFEKVSFDKSRECDDRCCDFHNRSACFQFFALLVFLALEPIYAQILFLCNHSGAEEELLL